MSFPSSDVIALLTSVASIAIFIEQMIQKMLIILYFLVLACIPQTNKTESWDYNKLRIS